MIQKKKIGNNQFSLSPYHQAKVRLAKSAIKKLTRLSKMGTQDNQTEWEGEFLGNVTARLSESHGAFRDPEKGDPSLPLSTLQTFKVNEIAREMKLRNKIGMSAARAQVFSKKKQRGSL